MAHFDNHNDGTLLSLITAVISSITCFITSINLVTYSFPIWIVQAIAMLAGGVSIVSGIIAIRKNLKK